jgi:hypothetical protein
MSWDGIYKSISFISVSGSPEIELALATAGHRLFPGPTQRQVPTFWR